MNTLHIKKGDTVRVITGKDKGKTGEVLRVFPAQQRVLVDGVNVYTKHIKPKKEGEKGQVVQIPRSIHVSNVAPLINTDKK